MSVFPFLPDSFRHPVQFPARTFDLALRLLLLGGVHLRQSFVELAAGTTQNGKRYFEIALDLFGRGGLRRLRLPLSFQKQFRLTKNAFAY